MGKLKKLLKKYKNRKKSKPTFYNARLDYNDEHEVIKCKVWERLRHGRILRIWEKDD